MTDKCTYPECGKILIHVEGRRKKKYCGAACKQKHWLMQNKKAPKTKRISIDEYNDYLKLRNYAGSKDFTPINWGHEKKEVKVIDFTKPTKEVKPPEQPKTNYTINTNPKTLDDIKAMCPQKLTGFERSEWIGKERQKYGI